MVILKHPSPNLRFNPSNISEMVSASAQGEIMSSLLLEFPSASSVPEKSVHPLSLIILSEFAFPAAFALDVWLIFRCCGLDEVEVFKIDRFT